MSFAQHHLTMLRSITKWSRTLFAAILGFTLTSSASAQITEWVTGTTIPGTESIEPGPGMNLFNWNTNAHNLMFADLSERDMRGSSFAQNWMDSARFNNSNLAGSVISESTLSSANFSHANLSGVYFVSTSLLNADLSSADLTNAVLYRDANFTGVNLTDSNILGTKFGSLVDGTIFGFTQQQLYTTASYKQKTLVGASFDRLNLKGWDFKQLDLTDTQFENATLTDASFSNAIISNTKFNGAVGFTKDQLYSTASYQQKNLQGIQLSGVAMTGWNFEGQNLSRAWLGSASGANFSGAILSYTHLGGMSKEQLYSTASYQQKNLEGITFPGRLFALKLAGWDLSGQNLTNAYFDESNMKDAILSGAIIRGVTFAATTGFTDTQLYSTASYQAKDLRGVGFTDLNLTGFNLSGQNLTNATFIKSNLTNVDFSNARLTNVSLLNANIGGANFTNAIISGSLAEKTDSSNGFTILAAATDLTRQQLYSTASYQTKNLQRIAFPTRSYAAWDFSGQDLTQSRFFLSNFSGAIFSDATINGAAFTSSINFTSEHLYSTASYKQKNLSGIELHSQDLSDWNLSGQNLTNAVFSQVTWDRTNLSFADTRSAVFDTEFPSAAITRNTILPNGAIDGLRLVAGETLVVHDFDSIPDDTNAPTDITIHKQWSMSDGSFLKLEFDADAWDSTIVFRPGINVQLGGTLELDFAKDVDVTSQAGRTLSIFHWDGVTPTGQFTVNSPYDWDLSHLYTTGQIVFQGQAGLAGDFDHDGTISAQDIDRLSQEIRSGTSVASFDLNGDTLVNSADRTVWVHDLRKTYFGDANLDGLFNTNDLVSVFQAGQYEDTIAGNSSWATGDWDGNGDFTTSDLVAAFQDGGYEQGPRTAAATAAVPEPGAAIWLIMSMNCIANRRRAHSRPRRLVS